MGIACLVYVSEVVSECYRAVVPLAGMREGLLPSPTFPTKTTTTTATTTQ